MYFLLTGTFCAILAAVLTNTITSRRIGSIITSFILGGATGYLTVPTLAWNFGGVWFLSFMIIVTSAVFCAKNIFDFDFYSKVPLYALIAWAVLCFGGQLLLSAPMLHSGQYRALIGKIQPVEFDGTTISPVDITQVRVVDQEIAQKIGEKRLGEIAGLGSRVTLGTMTSQKINGSFTIVDSKKNKRKLSFNNDLYWVGPLYHSGFLKQWGNGYTDGYILVSGTDTSKSYLVTGLSHDDVVSDQTGGRMGSKVTQKTGIEDLKLRYFNTGGYFSYHIPRLLRNKGYMFKGLTDFSFEIDDDGRPFWVVTTFEKRIGFSGSEAIGVVTVDAQTGETEKYGIADTPEWVDCIQPEDFVLDQLQDHGEFVHGWLNPSNRDIVVPTPGASKVVGADGKIYLYTGIQSSGADTSTTAFVLVDLRTKDVFKYNISGANEKAAALALENAPGVKEAGYIASEMVMYNVAGKPAYFGTLKGSDGIPKMYGFVSLEDYTLIGVGKSTKIGHRDYVMALRKSGGQLFDDLVKTKELKTVVTAVTRETIGDTLYYYFLFEGVSGKEFFAATDLSLELKWTHKGSLVKVKYDEGEGINSINLSTFDNLEITLR
ncbi:MAG: hypothetical protein GY793_08585 [Proteobacteria bacterium]|nr:hypothetical protein [Pseudomonadota bacterium]